MTRIPQDIRSLGPVFALAVVLNIPWIIAISTKGEYCQWESFQASCPRGHVILVTKAQYGRMKLGRCVRNNLGYVGCSVDVLEQADVLCSGRSQCNITVPHPAFDQLKPCLEDLKSYLDVSYECLPVVSADPILCRSASYVRLTSKRGVLSSELARSNDCGSSRSPWRINILPGQKINFTLFDFSRTQYTASNCRLYATITDVAAHDSWDVCQSGSRVSHVQVTSAETVEVAMHNLETSTKPEFLLHYEVIGCPELVVPANTWVEHTDAGLEVGCTGKDVVWKLKCEDNAWNGYLGNCTMVPPGQNASIFGIESTAYGISLVIILAIAFVIAILIFTVGFVCLRKKRRFPANPYAYDRATYEKALYNHVAYNYNRPVASSNGSNQYSSILETPLPQLPVEPSDKGIYDLPFPSSGLSLSREHNYTQPTSVPVIDDSKYFELEAQSNSNRCLAASAGMNSIRSKTFEDSGSQGRSDCQTTLRTSERGDSHYTY